MVIDVPGAQRRSAERAAYAIGAQGLEIRDEETGVPRGRVHVVMWVPLSQRAATLVKLRTLTAARLTTRIVNADWVHAPTIEVAGLTIHGIEGAVGFGDGAHPTTRLCLEALQRENLASVLDVGTGTGILAIAAAKRGASRVVATDIDPLARAAARAAVTANGVNVRVQTSLPRGRFDLVIANLYRDVVVELAPQLIERTSRVLIVSGFTDARAIKAAFAGARIEERRRGPWRLFRITPRRPGRAAAPRR